MSEPEEVFSPEEIDAMNEKALRNQFFVPDSAYLDLALLKDFNIGSVYADYFIKGKSKDEFDTMQARLMRRITEYQKRPYDTVDTFFRDIGYNDKSIKDIMDNTNIHDIIFAVSPATKFLDTLIRHMVRNQNHSRPANKFIKKKLENGRYISEPVPVTYFINTYPLTLSEELLRNLGRELGEPLGVNIHFLNKDPTLFDETDWEKWMKGIECFYINSFRFTRSDFMEKKQSEMAFVGTYLFARKQFEKEAMKDMMGQDFDQQIQWITAQLGFMCDFEWLQNNDVRLTEERENIIPDETHPPELGNHT